MVVRELITKLGFQFDPQGADQADRAVDRLRSGFQALVALLAGSQVARFLHSMVQQTAQTGDEMARAAQQAGVSARAMQELAFAAAQSNVEFDNLRDSLSDLNERIFDAGVRGAGEYVDAFRAVGIQLRDSTGELKSADVVLMELADRFAQMPDGVTKTGIALKLLSDEGARLIPWLNEGSDGIQRLRDRAQELGVVLDEGTLEATRSLARSQRELRGVLQGLRNVYASELIPWLDRGIQRFMQWVQVNREILHQRLEQFARGLAAALDTVWGAVRGVVVAVDGLGKAFGETGRIAVWLTTIFGALALILGLNRALAVGTIVLLTAVIEDFVGTIEGKDSVFRRFGRSIREMWTQLVGMDLDIENHPWLVFFAALQQRARAVHEVIRGIKFLVDLLMGRGLARAMETWERNDLDRMVREIAARRAPITDAPMSGTNEPMSPLVSMTPPVVEPRSGAILGSGWGINQSIDLTYVAGPEGAMSPEEFEERTRRAVSEGTREALRSIPMSPAVP